MTEKRIDYLMDYLRLLAQLKSADYLCNKEIDECIKEINVELEI